MRSKSHFVETEAIKIVNNQIPSDDWVFRSIGERDYGSDFMIEIFDNNESTGDCFFVQSKGTEKTFTDDVKISFPVNTLKYAMLFNVPFFLFYTSITSKQTKFIWLQKYTNLVLNESNWEDKKSITILFPEVNDLSKNREKIIKLLANSRAANDFTSFIYTINELKFWGKMVIYNNDYYHGSKCIDLCQKISDMKNVILYVSELYVDENCPFEMRTQHQKLRIYRMISIFNNFIKYQKTTNKKITFIEKQFEILDCICNDIISSSELERLGYESDELIPF
ncbi:MAG: DUF4365 domain-containing protein [Providencia sp.]|uniref:DUF4365 domain-containing protein n=1 Tax=Providencia sp. TaxID=589 RepID=UPI001B555925|nr:DUF4365 domain-containing protein [Providencia sp.]MBP6082135.1 DUF4365 domain-containing protein [Providencia sp.]